MNDVISQIVLHSVGSFGGTLGYAFLLNAPVSTVLPASLTGLLMTTAVRDTMYGDLISGIARAVEALLLAACIALGVYTGLKLMGMMGGAAL